MKLIRFIKSHTPYTAGETAGFDPARAAELIARGVAVAVGSEPVASAAPAQAVTKPMVASKPAAPQVGGYAVKHAGGPWFQVVGPAGEAVGDKAKKADAEAEARRLNAEA